MDLRKQRRPLSEEIRKKIIGKHGKGKGYKTISKPLYVPVTTVSNVIANVIMKFKVNATIASLPGYGCKRNINPRPNRKMVRMVEKEKRITAKELQAELQGEGMFIADQIIRGLSEEDPGGLHF